MGHPRFRVTEIEELTWQSLPTARAAVLNNLMVHSHCAFSRLFSVQSPLALTTSVRMSRRRRGRPMVRGENNAIDHAPVWIAIDV